MNKFIVKTKNGTTLVHSTYFFASSFKQLDTTMKVVEFDSYLDALNYLNLSYTNQLSAFRILIK